MNDDFPTSDYYTEYKEYSKRRLALWTSKTAESAEIHKHERLGRAKLEKDGSNSQILDTLHIQTQDRLLNVKEKFGRMEEELDRRWEVVKRGIQGGVSWGKVDAMERIGSTGE